MHMQVGDYSCDCDAPYHGRDCELIETTTEETITIGIQDQEASAADDGKSGMSVGAIAALCIVLVLVLAVLLGFFMYLRNKREEEASVINDLQVISSANNKEVRGLLHPYCSTLCLTPCFTLFSVLCSMLCSTPSSMVCCTLIFRVSLIWKVFHQLLHFS